MFKNLTPLPFNAFATGLTLFLFANPVTAQSVEFEWQQTASNKAQPLTQFDHYAVHIDLQAVLVGIERRSFGASQAQDNSGLDLDHVYIGAQYLAQVSDNYAIWPLLQVISGYDDNMTGKSLTYNPQLVAIRKLSENIAIVAGAGALLHTTENQYYPVFGLVLQPSANSPWSGNLTVPEGLIAYEVNEKISLETGLRWQTRYYTTSEDQIGAAYLRTRDILMSLGALTQLTSQLQLSSRVTYAFEREQRFYDSSANLSSSRKPSSGFGFRLALSYHF